MPSLANSHPVKRNTISIPCSADFVLRSLDTRMKSFAKFYSGQHASSVTVLLRAGSNPDALNKYKVSTTHPGRGRSKLRKDSNLARHHNTHESMTIIQKYVTLFQVGMNTIGFMHLACAPKRSRKWMLKLWYTNSPHSSPCFRLAEKSE